MRASLQNYHQAPRKVRLLADLVRGKSVSEAITNLGFLPKRAALPVLRLIQSAIANVLNKEPHLKRDSLFIKSIAVDKGMVFKRFRPGAHGRAFPIKRKTSHIIVVLETKKLQAAS